MVNKLWSVHTMEYSSSIKRNKLLIHTTVWMDLKGIMPNKKCPPQMAVYSVIPLVWHSENDRVRKMDDRLVVVQN